MANGIELAVDQANEEGELACTLQIRAEDTQGDPSKAPRKAQKLTEDASVVACICGFFSGETLASGSIFSRAGLAMVSTGTNRVIQRQGFKTWFRAIASDPKQGSVTATYIKKGLDPRKVSVVHDNQDYSKGLAKNVFDKLGKRLAGRHMYVINPEETDYSAVVAQIKRRNPDVVYYGGYLPQAGELLRQLHDEGVRATFVTDDGALDDDLQRIIKGRTVNALAACPCADPAEIEQAQSFVQEYEARYGEPPGIFSAETFDVTNIAIEALRNLSGIETSEQVRAQVVDHFDAAEEVPGTVKTYSWSRRGELKAGSKHLFMWRWNNGDETFEMLGRVSDLVS